ncbi:Zinc finger C-x8-C-x5-C-x3-H type (and similar) [Novymonas esmeraldas]|uniref:Zinc finger C-x8-C-x5-C-x3-H type (And similar) n=1 Tax=Novymonas esmeraldas TaxID=1808958 RepID=A0AAW0ER64_9TRYP
MDFAAGSQPQSPLSAMGSVTRAFPSPALMSPTHTTPAACPRHFTHAPYLSSGNIVASDELDAVEMASLASFDGRRNGMGSHPGSPGTSGGGGSGPHNSVSSFNTSHPSANQLHSPSHYSGGKKNVCRHFLKGNCNRGSSCRFFHPGPIHRVITPHHSRTPTQRPLTPLADLAQQSSAFAAASPARSPHAAPMALQAHAAGRPPLMAMHGSCGGTGGCTSVCSNEDSFASPPSSPATSTSAHRPVAFTESPAHMGLTAPTLSSPSIGPQSNPTPVLLSRPRRGPGANPLPSLQLPDYPPMGCDDGTTEVAVYDSTGDGAPLSRPHSPSSPGPYRMPVYRAGFRPNTNGASGRGEGREVLSSPHQSMASGSGFSSTVGDPMRSPVPSATTRNNPYAYSPTAVLRQPSQPMSPLKRISNAP